MHNDVELAVLDHGALSNGERGVTPEEAHVLIASGYYRESAGSPYGARHYRRSLSDGSCLHLVVEDDRARLHHDGFDPHAGPFSLCMHLTHEARSEAVSYCAAAWSLLKVLAG